MNTYDESHYTIKGFIKYVSTVISWTIFVILSLVAVFLLYYYISVKLYSSYGDKFEPLFSVYTIITESMDPTISRYDVIINTKINEATDVEINDVITFISTGSTTYGMTITHRVIGTKTTDTGETCFVTRGDNNTEQDAACVTPNNVIGVVKAVIPKLGYIQNILSSGFGWFLLVLVPAIYIVFKDILKIFKSAGGDNSNNKNNKDDNKRDLNKKLESKTESKIENKVKEKDNENKVKGNEKKDNSVENEINEIREKIKKIEENENEFDIDFDEVEEKFNNKFEDYDEDEDTDAIEEYKKLKSKK